MLLMLMMRIVLETVCCRFGCWGLVIKLNFDQTLHKVCSIFWSLSLGQILMLEFGHYFAAVVLSRLWSWILVEILELGLVNILNFEFSREADIRLKLWWLVVILKINFDLDLCLNFGKLNSTLGSVVPLEMFYIVVWNFCVEEICVNSSVRMWKTFLHLYTALDSTAHLHMAKIKWSCGHLE